MGLGTLLPGFALFKCALQTPAEQKLARLATTQQSVRLFTATGAVEAERGAQEAWL